MRSNGLMLWIAAIGGALFGCASGNEQSSNELQSMGNSVRRYPNECGTAPPTEDKMTTMSNNWTSYLSYVKTTGVDPLQPAIEVLVVFHFVYGQKKPGTDDLAAIAASQMKVLNECFQQGDGTRFNFRLKNQVPHEERPKWFNAERDSIEESSMKSASRSEPANGKLLNVWVIGSTGEKGWSTFPIAFLGSPDQDGIVVKWDTLVGKGGNGQILVHEAGHWLGLLHTYEGGCSDRERIFTTPAENPGPNNGGCGSRDTCPNVPGVDPSDNFMSYEPTCASKFVKEQDEYMALSWKNYR